MFRAVQDGRAVEAEQEAYETGLQLWLPTVLGSETEARLAARFERRKVLHISVTAAIRDCCSNPFALFAPSMRGFIPEVVYPSKGRP